MVKVKACRCPRCGDDIYSRTNKDLRVCSCGAIFVDGGFKSPRYGFLVKPKTKWVIHVDVLTIAANPKILYDDFVTGKDNFGKIKPRKGETKDGQGT